MPSRRLAASVALALTAPLLAGLAPNLAAPAAAKPTVQPNVYELDGQPESIGKGPDGNMWATLSSNSNGDDVVRIKPGGALTYYDLNNAPNPGDIVALGGYLWVTTLNEGIARFDPANPTAETFYSLTNLSTVSIARGFDGNLVAAGGDRVWTIDPDDPENAASHVVTGMNAHEVTRGTDGRIWIADGNGRIVAVNSDNTEVFHEVGGNPQGIAAGKNGQIFYTNPGSNPQTLGRLKYNGTPKLTELGNVDPAFSVTVGRDGNYWLGFFNLRKAGRMTPQGKLTTFGTTFPDPYKPRHVAAGPNGTVWIALQDPGSDGALGVVRNVPKPDSTVTVKVKTKKLKFKKRSRRAVLRLACPQAEKNGPCRGTVRMAAATKPGKKLASASFKVKAGKAKGIKLRVKRATLKRMRGKGLRVVLTIKVKDGAGNTKTIKKKLKAVRR